MDRAEAVKEAANQLDQMTAATNGLEFVTITVSMVKQQGEFTGINSTLKQFKSLTKPEKPSQ